MNGREQELAEVREAKRVKMDRLAHPAFKQLVPDFLRLFIPSLLIVTVIAYGLNLYDQTHRQELQKAFVLNSVGLIVKDIELTFRSIISDLHFLAESNGARGLADGNEAIYSSLESDLLVFSQQKGLYDQIRFLDLNGMERVRINYNKGQSSVVPSSTLQNKKDRYYFADTLKLSQGDVFVSPLDLNVEQGRIEQPFKPMIRFGTPVFDSNGNKQGIVLLNFISEQLLTRFKKAVADNRDVSLSLLNRDGYWLSGQNAADEWGFMFTERKMVTFGSRLPNAWREIQVNRSGTFQGEMGHFLYATVYPVPSGLNSVSQFGAHRYYWKVVAHYPPAPFIQGIASFTNLGLYLLALLGVAIGAWFRARGRYHARQTVRWLKQSREALKEKVAERTRDLSKSYEQLELLLSSTGEGLYGVDMEGCCTFINQAALNTLGFQNKDQLLGQDTHELIHHSYADGSPYDAAACPMQKALQQGEGVYIDDEILWRADGSSFAAEYSCYPIRCDGVIVGAVMTFNDITKRKQAETEQLHLQRELHQARKMEALGQLTGGIAHDFNNILGIILGNTELALGLATHNSEPRLAKYLVQIEKTGGRARDLIAQMLAFSRSESDDKQPLQLQSLIQSDLTMLRSMLPTSIEIKVEFEEVAAVLMNPVQLNQLLMNLCINARDAMEGKGVITIRLSSAINVDVECVTCHQRVTGDWVELAVTDGGSGIDPDVLEFIFDPFYTTKDVGMGSGMGLSVIQGIMRSHKGHVLVETEQGKGTRFQLLFPLAKSETTE